ncbi:MAG: ribosome silencing factor [Planctomycetes bacterium]|nr:ribosome silencing factor [Planctomycetota bacterium]
MAIRCAEIACEKRATDIVIFDVQETFRIAVYFVIATGASARQLRSIAETLDRTLRRSGIHRIGIEGQDAGRWILLDFGDVVVHLMAPDAREYYDLELLWGDSPHLEWTPPDLPDGPDDEGIEDAPCGW